MNKISKENFIENFVDATISVFETYCEQKFVREKKIKDIKVIEKDINVISTIDLVEGSFHCTLNLLFPETTYLKLLSAFVGTDHTKLTDKIIDGAAEFLNVSYCMMKAKLNDQGCDLRPAIPKNMNPKDFSLTKNKDFSLTECKNKDFHFFIQIIFKN